MTSEEIKNEFTSCIEGSHTINLAVSILEERDELKQENKQLKEDKKKVREYIKNNLIQNDITRQDYEEKIKKLLEILGDKENERA